MTKGREESDRRVVPEDRRKTIPTAAVERGGKAATESKEAKQLGLRFETADSPQGADGEAATGQPVAVTRAVPKSKSREEQAMSAMTMEEVASQENLMRAFVQVARNDGAPGPDRQSIDEVEAHLVEILETLQAELLTGSYKPGMIRRVWIPKSGGGDRGLGIPNVIDRIVQQAVHQVLSPRYEPTFHRSSHGFRPERSCHTAIAEAKGYLEEGNEWVVDLDLEKFFDRVNHDRLMSRLAERIEDKRLLRLIREMLKAKVVMPDGVVVATEEGTPQGGPLSPLLSNIVLNELDWELEQRGHHFVRYADDCNVYVRSERAGKRVMESIVRFIEKKLKLKVNKGKSAVAKPEERHFLGFRLRREPMDGSVEVLLSKRSKDRIDGKIRELTPRNWGRSMQDCIQRVNRYLLGWIGFFHICTENEGRTLQDLDAHIRRRVRQIQVKQWKHTSTIVKRLMQLGTPAHTARMKIYGGRKSWWALSHNDAVNKGLRNSYLRARGLKSLAEEWRSRRSRVLPVTVPQQGQLSLLLG